MNVFFFFFFNDTATTEIYTLSLHDALPIYTSDSGECSDTAPQDGLLIRQTCHSQLPPHARRSFASHPRSEEHTSELQSRQYLVCRLLLEKKKQKSILLHLFQQ